MFFQRNVSRMLFGAHKQVTCEVHGFALSADLSILQSCQVREMTPESVLLLHSVSTSAGGGNESEQTNTLAQLAVLNRALALHIAKHSHLTVEEILAHIQHNSEMWFDSQQALVAGLVDSIL